MRKVAHCLLIASLLASCAVVAAAQRPEGKLNVALPAATDFTFECDLMFRPDSGGAAALIVYGQDDAHNGYELRISRHKLTLTLRHGARTTTLIEGVKVEPTATGRMDVNMRRENGRTTVEVRGKPAASVFDDTLASGVVAWGTTSSAVEMKNVSARVLIVPEYEARPDEAVVYTSGSALIRSTFAVTASRRVRATVPAGVARDSIEITDGGQSVPQYQIIDDPLARLAAGRGTMSELTKELTVEWESPQAGERDVTVECLIGGISWRPAYNLHLLDDGQAELTVEAVIVNSALDLDQTAVAVVSGAKGGSAGVTGSPAAGGLGGGGLVEAFLSRAKPDLYHSYTIPGRQDLPKDTTTSVTLLRKAVPFTHSYRWDSRLSENVSVVYEVVNDTDLPWAGGTMRVYRAGKPIGEDRIEWVRVGEQVELEIPGASEIRVEQDAEVEKDATRGYKREYQHTIRFEIDSPVAGRLELIARKPVDAEDEKFSVEPTEVESELYRWYIDLKPGQRRVITHEYRDDTSSARYMPSLG